MSLESWSGGEGVDRSIRKYGIDRTRLVAERFEDETVLVNVESGYYYSLSPTGADILELLEEGITADNLPPALFGDSENCERFRPQIDIFVERLAAEGIIIAREQERGASTHNRLPRYAADAAYEPPVLERFDDVRDLLLIDPIHQVDLDYGWPRRPTSESSLESRI